MVRNQTVLLRGVNDDVETMGRLVRGLADNNIFPVSLGGFGFGFVLSLAGYPPTLPKREGEDGKEGGGALEVWAG
jgi:hypothetical protein